MARKSQIGVGVTTCIYRVTPEEKYRLPMIRELKNKSKKYINPNKTIAEDAAWSYNDDVFSPSSANEAVRLSEGSEDNLKGAQSDIERLI